MYEVRVCHMCTHLPDCTESPYLQYVVVVYRMYVLHRHSPHISCCPAPDHSFIPSTMNCIPTIYYSPTVLNISNDIRDIGRITHMHTRTHIPSHPLTLFPPSLCLSRTHTLHSHRVTQHMAPDRSTRRWDCDGTGCGGMLSNCKRGRPHAT